MDEPRDLVACRFISLSGLFSQRVKPAVDIGVAVAPDPDHRIDHRLWLLSTRRTIQIDQSLTVDLPLEDRELRPNRRHIQWHISPPTFRCRTPEDQV